MPHDDTYNAGRVVVGDGVRVRAARPINLIMFHNVLKGKCWRQRIMQWSI